MQMLFKQRAFSWFDSYDIYDENGDTLFTVEGQPSWGHCLHVLDREGRHIGTVRQKVMAFMPTFELYAYEDYLGRMTQKMTFLRPRYTFDGSDWEVEGNFMALDYSIVSPSQGPVAVICKDPFRWTDTYVIDVAEEDNALCALLIVLAIDASKCN